jgi:ABC-type multidrug transport system ATPase subunit
VILLAIELSTSNVLTFLNNKSEVHNDLKLDGKSAIAASDLQKTYYSLYGSENEAVKGITFQAEKQSCFVILGTNGAGKSTLFKCMTGEVAPTKGDVFVGGSSISKEQAEARYKIGYCPQENSIIDLLTASEHIYFYGRLK